MPYILGGKVFCTKSAIKDRCSAILKAGEIKPADHAFLSDLLQMHPDAKEKIGPGIGYFYVGVNREYGSHGFFLRRRDGSRVDFSYRACLNPPTLVADARKAMRDAVAYQVADFKTRAFSGGEVRCALSGIPVTPETCEIDHVRPFCQIRDAFLGAEGLTLEKVVVRPSKLMEAMSYLEDEGLSRRWEEYHRAHARLRVLSKEEHLRKSLAERRR